MKRIFSAEQKARRKINATAWLIKNREKERKRLAAYNSNPANKDRLRAKRAAWVLKNPNYDKDRKASPEYKEKAKLRSALYRAANVEKLKNDRAAYRDRPEITARKALDRHRGNCPIEPPNRPRPINCDICDGTSNNGSRLHFDHCHSTGKFRGWLCNKCNMALGLVKDDPEILLAMTKYLTRTNIADAQDTQVALN